MAVFDFQNTASKVQSGAENQLVKSAQQATDKLQNKALAALGDRANANVANQLDSLTKRIQKGGLKAATEQVKNLATSKLAATIFQTGAKDELMAVDVFGISDGGILNNLAGKLSGFGASALEGIRKSTGLSTDLTSVLKKAAGGFEFDAKALAERVTNSLGGSSNILRQMSDGLQKTLTEGAGLDKAMFNQIEGVINNVACQFSSNNVKDARGIFDLVGQICGDSSIAKFFDVGAEANMLSGLFREAIELGVPEAIDVLVDRANSSTAADYALRGNIEVAVSVGDLATTDLMIEKLGTNRILADCPNASSRLLAGYRIPEGTASADLGDEYTKLTGVLDKLDPNWANYQRDGETVSDLTLYQSLSPDALKLLMREPSHQIAALIAQSYPQRSMREEVKAMRPYVAV